MIGIILTLLTTGFNSCTYEGLIDEPETPGQHTTNIAIDRLIVEKSSAYPDGFIVERVQINGQQYYIFKYCCPSCNEFVESYFDDGELVCTFSVNRDVAT